MADISHTSPADAGGSSYFAWGAILGGAVIAAAIAAILAQFGAAVGLSVGEPVNAQGEVSWAVIGASLWVVLVAIVSSAVGAYVAGRTRMRWNDAEPAEAEFRDGAHGLAVWATASLFIFFVGSIASALASFGAAISPEAGSAAELSEEAIAAGAAISAIFAFGTAAGAALGAGAAWFAAGIGGEHRDQNLSINTAAPAMFRRN